MVSLVLPQVRAGTSKRQRSHARLSPLGQPQLNVPRKESHPRGKPLQPRFPKEHHHRRAADDSLCVTRPQSKYRLQPGKKKGVVGLGRHISAAGRLRMHSNIFDNTDSIPSLTVRSSFVLAQMENGRGRSHITRASLKATAT